MMRFELDSASFFCLLRVQAQSLIRENTDFYGHRARSSGIDNAFANMEPLEERKRFGSYLVYYSSVFANWFGAHQNHIDPLHVESDRRLVDQDGLHVRLLQAVRHSLAIQSAGHVDGESLVRRLGL